MKKIRVAIIGAGPYGLSLASHLAAKDIEHRIFGRPMEFWSKIANAADGRYLKSYCFGTNISSPAPGLSFADFNAPRDLETFEPCSMANFAAYGRWFQEKMVPWVEPVDVLQVKLQGDCFALTLSSGEHLVAEEVIVATGLSGFAHLPSVLTSLPPSLVTHTAHIDYFATFKGRSVAVVGAGQSALEACALLREAGAEPTLLVREPTIRWHSRVLKKRSLWRQLRSPISGLGTGPKAWALTRFPGVMHRIPGRLRGRFVKSHLPAEGAWWLRERFENRVPVHLGTSIVKAREAQGGVELMVQDIKSGSHRELLVDHVIAGSGYAVDVDRLQFLDRTLRERIGRTEQAPHLDDTFQSSVRGLRFVGTASAMSFGPMFRFVVGAEYTAQVISRHMASHKLASA